VTLSREQIRRNTNYTQNRSNLIRKLARRDQQIKELEGTPESSQTSTKVVLVIVISMAVISTK
jgi:hypothetical protein